MKAPQPQFIIFLVAAAGIVIYMLIYHKQNEDIINRWHKEYPLLGIEQSMNSVVSHVIQNMDSQRFRDDPNSIFVQTDNGERYRIISGYFANGHETSLKDAVRAGKLLLKEANSDTLVVCQIIGNDTIKIKFKLLGDLKYPLSTDSIASSENSR